MTLSDASKIVVNDVDITNLPTYLPIISLPGC